MFWNRYEGLCTKIGKKPQSLRTEFCVSSTTITRWKNGATPKKEILALVASYFNVSEAYLLGYTDDRTPPGAKKESPGPDGQGEEVVVFHRGEKPRAYHLSEEQLDRIEAIVKDLRGAEADF